VVGIGLGLRWTFLEEALRADLPAELAFFELSPENYMRRGGYYPEALSRVRARRPLRSHGLMLDLGGRDPLDLEYLRQVREFLDEMELDAHSDHLCWSRSRGRYLHELLPIEWTAAEADRIGRRIREVSQHLGRPLAIENISAYAELGEAVDPKREAAFITRILEVADCGLLLDVNNAAINGENFGFDPWEFVGALPLERVESLHVAGGQRLEYLENRLIDTHGSSVNAEVRELMVRTLRHTGPRPVLYERDNDIPSFARLCEEVVELHAAYTEATGTSPAPLPAPEVIELRTEGPCDLDLACDYYLHPSPNELPPGWTADAAALYRRLVRGALRQPLYSFLERSAARLGETFDQSVDAWLAAGASPSPYLRDLPHDYVGWLEEEVEGRAEMPDWILELMRHELVHYRVSNAVALEVSEEAYGFVLDRPLRFVLPCERMDYAYAVHELPAALDDRSEPRRETTRLLVYRDTSYVVHYLELSDFAAGLLDRLLAGQSVESSLRDQLGISEGPLPDERLASAGRLLFELAQRSLLTVDD
jgi:uncharacterized protein (UPF0276 family)